MSQAPIKATFKSNPLPSCATCHWAQWHRTDLRCHLNPPQIRLPYENIAVWPVVPQEGVSGCSFFRNKNPITD